MAETAPTAALRFEITGDNSDLKAKFAEIEKIQQRTSEAMAKAYEGAGGKVLDTFNRLRETLATVEKTIGAAMNSGAEGVETAVTTAFTKSEEFVKKSLDGMVTAAASKMGFLGKLIASAWAANSGTVTAQIEKWEKQLAAKGSEALKSETGQQSLDWFSKMAAESADRDAALRKSMSEAWSSSSNFATGAIAAAKALSDHYLSALTRSTEATGELGEAGKAAESKIKDFGKAVRDALDVAAGERLSVKPFKEVISALDQMIAKAKAANAEIGKSVGERARAQAQALVDEKIGGQTVADDQQAEIDKKVAAAAAEAQRGADIQKGIRQEEQTRRILSSVKEQADLEAARSREMGKTAGEMARMQAEARANLSLTKADVVLNEEKKKLLDEQLDRVEREAQARAAANVNRQVAESGQNEINQIRLKMEALGLSAGAQAAAAFEAKAYADSIKQVGYVTEEVIAETQKWTALIMRNTDVEAEARRKFQQVQDAGNVLARGLENAFAKWTTGAKISVRDMVSSMLADMAQLAFKNSVSQLLFGQSGSVNNGGGIFGSLATTLFGKRENGGPAPAGVPIIVGEKRPEVFVPKTAGYVLPQVPAGNSAAPITNSISIDMRGATVDAVAKLRSELPGLMMRYTIEAQQRGARI